MATPYSQDLRDRVLHACDGGMPTQEVARVFLVSKAWVRRLKQRRRESGETAPRPMGGATVIKIDPARLRGLVDAQPDATLKELVQRLNIDVSLSGVSAALHRLGLSFKKRRSPPRSRSGRTSRNAAGNGRRGSGGWIPGV